MHVKDKRDEAVRGQQKQVRAEFCSHLKTENNRETCKRKTCYCVVIPKVKQRESGMRLEQTRKPLLTETHCQKQEWLFDSSCTVYGNVGLILKI